jgi:hypothetical protein
MFAHQRLVCMELGLITNPKRGTFGATISQKALRKLKQVGKHRV